MLTFGVIYQNSYKLGRIKLLRNNFVISDFHKICSVTGKITKKKVMESQQQRNSTFK